MTLSFVPSSIDSSKCNAYFVLNRNRSVRNWGYLDYFEQNGQWNTEHKFSLRRIRFNSRGSEWPRNNTTEMTRERQELLPQKRPTWAQKSSWNVQKQCLSRAPYGALARYCSVRPLVGVWGAGLVQRPSFLLTSFIDTRDPQILIA